MVGKLIVLEGTDGAGKATQAGLLAKRLLAAGKQVASVSFPRYGEPSARLVERYLRGEYQPRPDAYQAAVMYAIDRYEASFQLHKDLAAGATVVADRYTPSNLAHQGGSIRDEAARRQFYDYVTDLEYERLKIPRPTKILLLHVPVAVAQKLVDGKSSRQHLGSLKRDLHEADLEHLKNAGAAYLELRDREPELYQLINCSDDESSIKPIDEIHELVWAATRPLL